MLKLTNVFKEYGSDELKVTALKGISMCFRKSEFVSILGPSGCGKTTLLNIIGGLDRYTSGDLVINGISTKNYLSTDWDTYRNQTIGFVFQSYNLVPHLTVLGNVELALSISGYNKRQRQQMAKQALVEVGLGDQLHKRPNQLSGGQMQRVAIARALVNNPKILLADEPTGALDSETSLQVMAMLEEISKDRLVIMVTHNPDLAEKYSTRIIKVFDGKVTDDSAPYSDAEEQEESLEYIAEEQQKEQELLRQCEHKHRLLRKLEKRKKKQSSMSIFSSIALSAKNLIMKKGRTFMTAFAGSIGIIGIALILSVSNGLSMFIENIQREGMAEYPITISPMGMDLETISNRLTSTDPQPQNIDTGARGDVRYPDTDVIYPFNPEDYPVDLPIATNDLAQAESFLIDTIETDWIATINYSRNLQYNLLTQTSEGYQKLDMNDSGWCEFMSNDQYAATQYGALMGKLPTAENEIALVINRYNRLSTKILKELGINCTKAEGSDEYDEIAFDSIIGKKLYLVFNNAYYTQTEGVYSARTDYDNIISQYTGENENLSMVMPLEIVGITRIKEGSVMDWVGTGIIYTNDLTDLVYQNADTSDIVKDQRRFDTTDVFTGKRFQVADIAGALERVFGKEYTDLFKNVMSFIGMSYDVASMSKAQLQVLGGDRTPTQIYICPSSFENKEKIIAALDEYNAQNPDAKINYVDTAGMFLGMVDTFIEVISYVLIAFSSISLVVSSVMIGIITYVSVVERTKEIGVLRSLGARKLDISRVFNSETLIIGTAAGVFGVVITYVLCLIASTILYSLTNVANLAVLNPVAALILIGISIVLNMLAGLIPAVFAARKDPVVALRTE